MSDTESNEWFIYAPKSENYFEIPSNFTQSGDTLTVNLTVTNFLGVSESMFQDILIITDENPELSFQGGTYTRNQQRSVSYTYKTTVLKPLCTENINGYNFF